MRSTEDSGATPVEFSIVMPCLNEAETLGVCLRKAFGFLAAHGIEGEVVVGDNGSSDGSQRIAFEAGARVVNVPVRGYGAALYYACKAARGRYIIMGDSDDSYDFSRLEGFVERLRAGDDLVMGNRFRGAILPRAMPWKNRYIGNPILSGIGRAFFRTPLGDFHCGIRGLSKAVFETMDLRTTGMEFASEMVIKATLMKLKTSEVPTTLSPDGRSRPPHLRPWRDGWRHLRFMLLFSPNWLFLYPGLLMMAAGLVCGASVLAGPVTIRGVQFDVDALIFFAFFVVIGLQAVLFAFLSRVYATQEKLYPPTAGFSNTLRIMTLERGLISGALIVLTGILLGGYSILDWSRHGFGSMDFASLSRLVIPSATATAVGVELIFFSFFFSTLQLSVRDLSPDPTLIEIPQRIEKTHADGLGRR
ncbi:MAG TPA: glycosyltransferase family 2 protein [Bryobacteraceae bacterium]|jgi:glycosyltransferase involved in cell wall biosynthesis|nr:glycosyltransferase family 2 protein [Bryobacteraceae bacterium]